MRNIDEKRQTEFDSDYLLAWEASGKPSVTSVQEILVTVLEGNPIEDARLHPLYICIKHLLAENKFSINWFTERLPKKENHTPPLNFLGAPLRSIFEGEEFELMRKNIQDKFQQMIENCKPDDDTPKPPIEGA